MSEILSQSEKLKEEVLDQLYWDSRINTENVRVDIADKNVVLSGTIPSHNAKLAAEADAYSVPGVSLVRNNLKIEYSRTHSDAEILNAISCVIEWNPDIDSSEIDMQVKDGTVILQGPVSSFWQKKLLNELVFSITGVTNIENNITVKPSENIIDQSIEDAIIAALEMSPFVEAQSVGVKVKDAAVTLFGTVPNCTALNETLTLAGKIVGIVDVSSELKIEPQFNRINRRR